MILIDNIKYSCLECIRGHRSTLCRHHMRPLLQVRSKGRPNLLFPYGNKNYRIAVFAQEVDNKDVSLDQGCKSTPVVILKASDKHVIDVTNGQIMGPYDDLESNKPVTPVVGPEDFVVSSVCCSTGVSKVRKGCKCNQKKVLRLKILRSYISKKMALPNLLSLAAQTLAPSETQNIQFDQVHSKELLSYGSGTEAETTKKAPERSSSVTKSSSNDNGVLPTEDLPPKKSCCSSKIVAPGPQYPPQRHDFDILLLSQQAPSYADVSYPGIPCKVPQNMYNPASIDPPMPAQMSSHMPLHMSSQMGAPLYTVPDQSQMGDSRTMNNQQGVFQVINVPSCSIPGSCSCSSDCSCPSCVVHKNPPIKAEDNLGFLNNDAQYGSNLILKLEVQGNQTERYVRELPRDIALYSTYLAQFHGFESNPPPFISELQMELQSVLQERMQQQQQQQQQQTQDFQTDQSPCSCPDNDCFCTNCETHGIIDGYKLDDFFGTNAITNNGFLQG